MELSWNEGQRLGLLLVSEVILEDKFNVLTVPFHHLRNCQQDTFNHLYDHSHKLSNLHIEFYLAFFNCLPWFSCPRTLSDFLTPLLQLAASPIYSVRTMASKALVAMTPPSEYMNILIRLTAQLPNARERCCHNRLHGQLLQIKAVVDRALCSDRWDLKELVHPFIRLFQAFEVLVGFCSQCPFRWPMWSAEKGGRLTVVGNWNSTLPPCESGLSGSGRITEETFQRGLPEQAQRCTNVWAPDASTWATGARSVF